MRENYLIHGTNAMRGALRYVNVEQFLYEPQSVQIYLSAACTTLSLLMEDKEYLNKIADGINKNPNEIYHQFEDFIDEFVRPDQALMMAAGMDEKMGQYLFKDLAEMQRLLDTEQYHVNSNKPMTVSRLRERIKELQYSACEEGKSNKRGIINGRSVVWRAIRVIGGGAVITTNIAADTVIGGLASAYSQAFGGFIVGKGLEG